MRAFTSAVLFRLIRRIIWRQKGNAPDRQRDLDRDCLEIPVIPGRPDILVSGLFLIRVSIYQGGSVALCTSNYRTPEKKRAGRQREKELGCVEIPSTPGRPEPVCIGLSLTRVIIYRRCSGATYTSNYRAPMAKRARSTSDTGTRLYGNTRCVLSPAPVGSGLRLTRARISQGGSVSPYT